MSVSKDRIKRHVGEGAIRAGEVPNRVGGKVVELPLSIQPLRYMFLVPLVLLAYPYFRLHIIPSSGLIAASTLWYDMSTVSEMSSVQMYIRTSKLHPGRLDPSTILEPHLLRF